jgi:putative transposase
MLKDTLSMSERLACKAVGLARSTYRRLPIGQTPADPDAEMRAWLRAYATKHQCHGFRRAWAALRFDERREVNKKKIHRLWREEGLQVKVVSPRKRAGVSSIPPVEADAANVVWAIDFQFDSTIDGKAIKIASMIDEHPRITAASGGALDHRRAPGDRVAGRVRRGRWAAEGAADGQRSGVGFPSAATVLRGQDRTGLRPARLPVGQRPHRIVQQPTTQGVSLAPLSSGAGE